MRVCSWVLPWAVSSPPVHALMRVGQVNGPNQPHTVVHPILCQCARRMGPYGQTITLIATEHTLLCHQIENVKFGPTRHGADEQFDGLRYAAPVLVLFAAYHTVRFQQAPALCRASHAASGSSQSWTRAALLRSCVSSSNAPLLVPVAPQPLPQRALSAAASRSSTRLRASRLACTPLLFCVPAATLSTVTAPQRCAS